MAEDIPQEKQQMETEDGGEQEQEDSERGRPSTPKWWRPPIPPETYKWEEVRRQRQKGGYPWTHLDKDEEIDVDDYLDENLYEPVNPPPLYGNESYLSKDLQQVPQASEPPIQIPPEIDIITSEGLDGLDKPDRHDGGFDGDKEWQHTASEDEQVVAAKSGIKSKSREPRSSTPKSVGFSPETITHEVSTDEPEEQEAPCDEMETEGGTEEGSSSGGAAHSGHTRTYRPFDILKAKAANAAEHVKEKIRLAIPVRPRLNQWQGVKRSKKRRKTKQSQEEEEGEQEVPEDVEMKEAEGEAVEAAGEAIEQMEGVEASGETEGEPAETDQEVPEKSDKEKKKEEKEKEKEEKEKKKAEEKLAKQKAAEEAKKAKLEEKLAKAREAEELRQAKAEEEKKKQLEKEEAAKKAAEAKKEEEERKAAEKAAKEEEARIAAEAKKAEEEARKAAEKAKKEEEAARKAAEKAKKEEEAAKKAAEKAKKEEEARKAAEAKKAEEEAKKAAEKAKKEEEQARKAAEKAKADEEKRLAAEKAKQEEEERKAKEAEIAATAEAPKDDAQPMDTTEATSENVEGATEDANVEEDEANEQMQPQTPSGTTKRRYIRHRRQLPEIPNPITALKNQVEDFIKLKRSRTPPRRPVQRKHRRSRSADASRSPPRDSEESSEKAPEEGEAQLEEDTKDAGDEVQLASQETGAESKKEDSEVQQTDASAPEAKNEEEQAPSENNEPPRTSTGTITRRRPQPAKEKLDKIGAQLKDVGSTVLDVAAQATKVVVKPIKVVGKLGSKAIEEMINAIPESKPDAAKNSATVEEQQPEPEPEPQPEPVEVIEDILPPQEEIIAPPKRTFRFRRRGQSQEEADEAMERQQQEHVYENANEVRDNDPFSGNQLLGSNRARDWESPQDHAHSREVSEEPYSGNASARDSPPGSSLASSTFAQVRRTGVLEEIDSDEFFLRERGISEGEDEEDLNRFLVEELRQAFRPSMSNALAGFDMEMPQAPPPPRPERAPRKPPRKDKDSPVSYQTFPPERPKRKGPQGYVSKFMKEREGEEYEDMDSNEEVRGSSDDMREEDVEGDEALELVKEKLSELDRDLDEEGDGTMRQAPPTKTQEEFEDDGRYEPISEGPVRPTRTKRKKPRRPPTPPSFYYNTIAGNEWHRELAEHTEPKAPIRKRRDSGKSASLPPAGADEGRDVQKEESKPETEGLPDEGITFSLSFPVAMEGRITTGTSEAGTDDTGDYVDEAGYAIVQKDRDAPRTIPRKKKKRTKVDDDSRGDSGTFFSLPRASPRTIHIVPPSRPNRTYSTLKPRRPPRSKSGSRQNLENKSPVSTRREGDEPRPSTAIGIMQGRPLPPPPRPLRSPAPYNELDQSSIERSVGLQHYANFEEIEARTLEEGLTSPPPRVAEVDIACQTDPVPEDEFVVGLPVSESPSLDSSRMRTTASPRPEETRQDNFRTPSPMPATTGDVSSSFQAAPSQAPPPNTHTTTESYPRNQSPSFSFPTRLHLEQLEVDFLRVNDIVAQTIKVDSLQTSQLEVNSMNATGHVNISRIQTQSLSSDEVNCSRLSSDTVDLPSVPPSSFFKLSSPEPLKPGSEQELCLKTEENEEKENESACPPDFPENLHNLMGNVDSTNGLKSSHVAEKNLDEHLKVSDSPLDEQTVQVAESYQMDVSVEIQAASTQPQQQQPLNVPPELNDLSQEPSSRKDSESATSNKIDSVETPPPQQEPQQQRPQQNVDLAPQRPQRTSNTRVESSNENKDKENEENVVVGSYTLPYSYMSPQSPSLSRTSSLRRSQRSSGGRRPSSPSATTRDEPHVAFGHTSVAQGDVLSVKLSIPVEQMPTGRSTPNARPPASSNPTQLPDSTKSKAESQQKDGQQKKQTPKDSPPVPPPGPVAGPSSQIQRGPAEAEEDNSSFLDVSVRLGRAVLRFSMRTLQAMADYIDTASSEDPAKAEQQRANMQVLMCLLLFLVVGLILATARSGPYISPRWEFLMPPPDL